MRVADLEKEITEKIKSEKSLEEYNFDDFLLNLNNYATESRDIIKNFINNIEEEIKPEIKRKIKKNLEQKNKLDVIQKRITQYPLSFNITSNLMRVSLIKEDLSQIKEIIAEKYQNICIKISKKFSLKNNLKPIDKNQPHKDTNIGLQNIEPEYEKNKINQVINQTQNKELINQTKNRVETRKSTVSRKEEVKKEDLTDLDYEKLMKRDELRRKLEARKKISISKSKIDKELEEARRK